MSEQETPFSSVLSQASSGEDGSLIYPAPENWRQGRTAYGGFTSAVVLDAVMRKHDGLPPLRSMLVDFTAPVSESPSITSEVLRAGRNITTINARAHVGGGVAAQSTLAFGAAQQSELHVDCRAPAADAPEETDPYFPPGMKRSPVRFFDNFEMRLIEGSRPFSGASRGYTRVWARHRDPKSREGIIPLVCMADLLPPAAFPMLKTIGPNSSVTWICNLLTDDTHSEDGWFMIETNLTAARDGYSSQVMRMWNAEGTLIAEGMQSVIIFV